MSTKDCFVCNKIHRHFIGLKFEQFYRGKVMKCENCSQTHKIGFKKEEENIIFLGSSTFYNVRLQNLKKCVVFDTTCGGKIDQVELMYDIFLRPLIDYKFIIIISIGLNDFHRKDLSTLKQNFHDLKKKIEKNPNHKAIFGTLLIAPKLVYHLNMNTKRAEKNSFKMEKMQNLNRYLKTLSSTHYCLDKFGYSLKRRHKLRLQRKRWREFRGKDELSVLKSLHLKPKHQKIALKSLLNQIHFKLYGTKLIN